MRFMTSFFGNLSGAVLNEYSLGAVVFAGMISAASTVVSAELHAAFTNTGALLATLVF